MASLEEQFEQALTEIQLGNTGQHLLEADAVTECVINGESATITLDLPADDDLRKNLSEQVETRIKQIDGISTVNIRMSDQAGNGGAQEPQAAPGVPRAPQRPQNKTYLDNYDAIVAVASGKGGVGKSTVSVNLAVTLARMGHSVSLFDSDIYGPSLPIMMGLRGSKPQMEGDNLIPLEKYGVSVMSIGNLVDEAAATIWRGPIVHQVLEQLLRDTQWPGGDFMIIDLPPGTGDAQLTLTQLLALSGAVIVSTPQDVALLDALKGIAMFQKVDVPILGLVENMSSFVCPHCDQETPIFDKGNAQRASGQHNIPFLGRVPIELAVREGGDNGAPVASSNEDTAAAQSFNEIAKNLIAEIEKN